jgi:glycosyltransferase involved in cell wall biosynthesis
MKKNQEIIEEFKPSYVWPNPAFHFRLYYENDKCRIFLIENIAHNWLWLKEYSDRFRKNDFFIVQLGWYFDDYLVNECERIFQILELNKDRFYFMFPDYAAKTLFEYYNFKGGIVNHNCFLDEKLFEIRNKEKIYDAIYTARRAPFKRHYLASKVEKLALIVGDNSGASIEELPSSIYLNERHLSPDEVIDKLCESKIGLILSEFEGACYSSSEYLLCGIPVVSTRSHGGRDLWYNSYNSIVCDPQPDSISEAVKRLASYNRDPEKIREMHIKLSNQLRKNFIFIIEEIFNITETNDNAKEVFENKYKHKLLTSEQPDFDKLFN